MVPRRARRGCAGCELRDPALATSVYVGEVQFTLVQQICAKRMQLKTAVVKMIAST